MSEDRLQTREADPLISQWLDLVSSPYIDPSQMRLIGTEMGSEIMQLRAETERLRAALKPFADCAEAWDHDTADLSVQLLAYDDNEPAPALSVGQFRHAREVLEKSIAHRR